jgi:uncharacterized protein (DUF58 family)
VTSSATPKLRAYVLLTAAGLLAALVLGRPELAALATPFAAWLALGIGLARRPELDIRYQLDRERALQGDRVNASIEIESDVALQPLELLLRLPAGLASGSRALALHVRVGEPGRVGIALDCKRWGGYSVGDLQLRARDRFGLRAYDERLDLRRPLRVYPREETVRSLLAPTETQATAGNEVARAKGDGIEFADIRPFVPGDRVRRINWRASARRPGLWVNESHPERNTDVIIFLDSFAEARHGATGTLDLAVRAAGALAARYLRRSDRVGLVSFGGVLRWLEPSMGSVQHYRIVDALLDTDIALSYAWKGADVIPPRTLPPQALVIGLTPLLDERSIGALLDLRARGFDLAIVDVSPLPFLPPARDRLERLSRRVWALRREVLRHEYQQLGVAVAEWRDGEPLEQAVEEVRRFRRSARAVRA